MGERAVDCGASSSPPPKLCSNIQSGNNLSSLQRDYREQSLKLAYLEFLETQTLSFSTRTYLSVFTPNRISCNIRCVSMALNVVLIKSPMSWTIGRGINATSNQFAFAFSWVDKSGKCSTPRYLITVCK